MGTPCSIDRIGNYAAMSAAQKEVSANFYTWKTRSKSIYNADATTEQIQFKLRRRKSNK